MNYHDAMQATVEGSRVTHDGLGRDTYVDYHFDGFKHKTMKRFGEWASCSFIAGDADIAADWREETRAICVVCHGFVKQDAFGKHCGCSRKSTAITETGKKLVREIADEVVFVLDPSKEVKLVSGQVTATFTDTETYDAFKSGQAALENEVKKVTSAWAGVTIPEPKRDSWGRPID